MIHACRRNLEAALKPVVPAALAEAGGTKSNDARPRVSLAGLAGDIGLFLADARAGGDRRKERQPGFNPMAALPKAAAPDAGTRPGSGATRLWSREYPPAPDACRSSPLR